MAENVGLVLAGFVGLRRLRKSERFNRKMKSFDSLLQNNVLDTKKCETRKELHMVIVTWIERKYHRRCRQRSLGRVALELEAVFQVIDEEDVPAGPRKTTVNGTESNTKCELQPVII